MWPDVEGWFFAELTSPMADGTHKLEIFIQLVRHHAQHIGEVAVHNFVLEVTDDNPPEAHDVGIAAPRRRIRPGWFGVMIIRPSKAKLISLLSDCAGHRGSGSEL
jgi:hypothetical protein